MLQITSPEGHALVVHELGGSGRPTLLSHATWLHDGFARLGEVGCPVVVACGDEGFGPVPPAVTRPA